MIRSPVADPKSKGMISGLTLDTSEKQLALLYLATIQGIAYGTRHIVEHCNSHGHKVLSLSVQVSGAFETSRFTVAFVKLYPFECVHSVSRKPHPSKACS